MKLHEIATFYALDKCISSQKHNYIPAYETLFENKKEEIKNILEIGIGCVENGQMSGVVDLGYKTGNSLRCWRDYFTNAQIYGIDIYPVQLNENRITTFVADQSNNTQLQNVVDIVGDNFDIIIDDGSHILENQVSSFMFFSQYLKPGNIYCIEDCQPLSIPQFLNLSCFPDYFKQKIIVEYDITYFDTRHILGRNDDFIVAFTKKNDEIFINN